MTGHRLEEAIREIREGAKNAMSRSPQEVFESLTLEERLLLSASILADPEMTGWAFQAGTSLATLVQFGRRPITLLSGLCASRNVSQHRMVAAALLQLEGEFSDAELLELISVVEPVVDQELALIWLSTGSSRWYRLLRHSGAERILSLLSGPLHEIAQANLDDRLPDPDVLAPRDD